MPVILVSHTRKMLVEFYLNLKQNSFEVGRLCHCALISVDTAGWCSASMCGRWHSDVADSTAMWQIAQSCGRPCLANSTTTWQTTWHHSDTCSVSMLCWWQCVLEADCTNKASQLSKARPNSCCGLWIWKMQQQQVFCLFVN